MEHYPEEVDDSAYCDGDSAWNGDSAGGSEDVAFNKTNDSTSGECGHSVEPSTLTKDSTNGSSQHQTLVLNTWGGASAFYDGDCAGDGHDTQLDTSASGDNCRPKDDVDSSSCINRPQNESETADSVQPLEGKI